MFSADHVRAGLQALEGAMNRVRDEYGDVERFLNEGKTLSALRSFWQANTWAGKAQGQFTWLNPAIDDKVIQDPAAVTRIQALFQESGELLERGNVLYQDLNRALQMHQPKITSL